MTERDLLNTIKSRIVAQTWTGSANIVFPVGSVLITNAMNKWTMANRRVPLCIIRPGPTTSDPEFNEEPDFVRFDVGIRLICAVTGDEYGENPLMGANKLSATRSEGRGIFEIEAEVHNAIGKINALESITLQNTQRSAVEVVEADTFGFIAYRDYTFSAYGTMV